MNEHKKIARVLELSPSLFAKAEALSPLDREKGPGADAQNFLRHNPDVREMLAKLRASVVAENLGTDRNQGGIHPALHIARQVVAVGV